MVKSPAQESNTQRGRQFYIYGRENVCESNPNPEVTVMKIIAKNSAFAKSKFWKIMRT